MARLCERPGCSAPAACVYGIDSRRLTVWIDGTVPADAGSSTLGKRAGVLCRRHADSMVVPIGWTLDDRRTASDDGAAPRRPEPLARVVRRRVRRSADEQSEQLALLEVPADAPPTVEVVPVGVAEPDGPTPAIVADGETAVGRGEAGGDTVGAPSDAVAVPPGDGSPPPASPWRPVFDQTDDLGGLLATRSPLLARAFGKRDRATAHDEQVDR